MARTRRSFTKEYKAEVVKLIWTSGKNPGVLARELGLTETSVRAWMKRAAIDEKRDPLGPLTSEERAENTRLRRELRTMTMERDFLRKAAAFFARSAASALPSRPTVPACSLPLASWAGSRRAPICGRSTRPSSPRRPTTRPTTSASSSWPRALPKWRAGSASSWTALRPRLPKGGRNNKPIVHLRKRRAELLPEFEPVSTRLLL